ncbi:MAG: hypothetical protein HYX48_04805 [Chlamydiales bacterium]|nr:hypothetical protein [Chlamydiales bacterium]
MTSLSPAASIKILLNDQPVQTPAAIESAAPSPKRYSLGTLKLSPTLKALTDRAIFIAKCTLSKKSLTLTEGVRNWNMIARHLKEMTVVKHDFAHLCWAAMKKCFYSRPENKKREFMPFCEFFAKAFPNIKKFAIAIDTEVGDLDESDPNSYSQVSVDVEIDCFIANCKDNSILKSEADYVPSFDCSVERKSSGAGAGSASSS